MHARLENLTYEEVAKLNKEEVVVILPMGPLEAHGPHLPLGVDINGANVLAEMTAQLLNRTEIRAVIAPTLSYTLADVALPFAGTISLARETVISIVQDIALSLSKHGFKHLVIICHHLERPNLAALKEAAERSSRFGISILISETLLNALPECFDLMKGEYPELDFHAGEWETALYLWKYPHLVNKEILLNLPPNWSNIRKKFEGGAKDFIEAGGPDCFFGDPAKADAELGEKVYTLFTHRLVEEINNWKELNKVK